MWTGCVNVITGASRAMPPSLALAFPFPIIVPGQRELAVAAYRVLANGGRLFLAAPTGIGKTISVLFPAVKALGEGKLERIFYLTARTVGRAIAEKALG
jgi:DNA excision repair protein ERCC-2